MFSFAASWTALDFLQSFNSAGGTVSTPAAAEVGAPLLIQSASLVGFAGVTFLLAAFSADVAASLTAHKPMPAIIAAVLFAANAGFGYLRMSEPPTGTQHFRRRRATQRVLGLVAQCPCACDL
jgi:apolipoprotein N-acyltransferase